jgi:hypothetical protein
MASTGGIAAHSLAPRPYQWNADWAWDKLAAMDFTRLDQRRTAIGGLAAILLVVSILFLPWYSLSDVPERAEQGAWLCGADEFSCTGFETFPLLRWLLLASALAPIILAWIIVRGHQLAWAPGELTMVVGFAAMVLILYNGVVDRPAPDDGVEFGIGLDYGYWIALLSSVTIAGVAFARSLAGQTRERKAPGTV